MNINTTKLPTTDRVVPFCKVVSLGSGSIPKFITIELPNSDGARINAWYTGSPSNVAVDDYVRIQRQGVDKRYVVVGYDQAGADAAGDTVKVSSNDTTPNYLISKMSVGEPLTLVQDNDGGDEDALFGVDLSTLTEETAPADDDLILMQRASDSGFRKVQFVNVGGGGAAINNIANGRISIANSFDNSLNLSLDYTGTELFLYPWGGNQSSVYNGSEWEVLTFSTISIKSSDTQSGTRTSGSAIITGLTDTSQWVVGMEVSGTGIPASTTIASIDSATQITMSANATSSGTSNVAVKIPANKNVDVFEFNNSGSLKLEFGPLWTNDTTRATGLTTQDGIYVKSGDATRKYRGTVRTNATAGQLQFTRTNSVGTPKLFVWNMYNRHKFVPLVQETTNNWTYDVATWRALNNSNSNRFEFVIGLREDTVKARAQVNLSVPAGNNNAFCGVALDATNTNHAQIVSGGGGVQIIPASAEYEAYLLGYHFLQMTEIVQSAGTSVIFYGDAGLTNMIQSGMKGEWWG